MSISVEPSIIKIHGYGFMLESERIESPSECFNALTKGIVLNLTDSTKDLYVSATKEYYYYKSNLYSFGLGKLSWEKYKKYFTCEKFHINQDDDNMELFTRDIKVPIE